MSSSEVPGPGRPVILVVEDELLVRMIAAEAIEQAGYEVVEADNADRALALLDGRDDIAVLFTDIRMPGKMDGLALAAVVRERWPAMPIILTSGHIYADDIGASGAACFLQKPYRARVLINELTRLAASRSAREEP